MLNSYDQISGPHSAQKVSTFIQAGHPPAFLYGDIVKFLLSYPPNIIDSNIRRNLVDWAGALYNLLSRQRLDRDLTLFFKMVLVPVLSHFVQ